jgi:hypothetical protein
VRKDGLHYRPATCAEVECPQWKNGWITRVPVGSDLDRFLAGKTHGRRFFARPGVDGGERTYSFPEGQECFRSSTHRVPIEREPFFVVRDGDWRGNPRGTAAVNRRPDDWVDDFANHQQRIADARDQG